MIKKTYATVIVLILIFSGAVGQKKLVITGTVTDSTYTPLEMASIIVSKFDKTLSYTTTNNKGNYILSLVVDSLSNHYVINASYLGYYTVHYPLNQLKDSLNISFVLKPNNDILKEVIIEKPKSLPDFISTSEDTLTYKVSKFSNGTESNIEELLLKLPGIQVDDKGKVSYKGKSIDKIMLDGNNILGSDYRPATRSLSVDLIDNIQAIENYYSNKVLQGLSDKETILNLNIKEEKKKALFGNLDLMYGNQNYRTIKNNSISYLKKIKTYVLTYHSNTGISLYDENNLHLNSEYLPKELTHLQNQRFVDPSLNILPFINPKNWNFNEEVFSNINTTFPIRRVIQTTCNFHFYHNNLKNFFNQKDFILSTADTLTIYRASQYKRKPILWNGRLYFDYPINAKNKLEYQYIAKYATQQIFLPTSFESDTLTNTLFESLSDYSLNTSHTLTYTHRISLKQALVGKVSYMTMFKIQDYSIDSDRLLFSAGPNQSGNLNYIQSISYPMKVFNTDFQFLHKLSDNRRFIGKLGVNQFNQELSSNLLLQGFLRDSITNTPDTISTNNINNIGSEIYFKPTYQFKFFSLDIISNLGIHLYSFQKNNSQFPSSYWITETQIIISSKIGKYGALAFSYSFKNELTNLNTIYQNPLLINNRTLITGLSRGSTINKHLFFIIYQYTDLFKGWTVNSRLTSIFSDNAIGYNLQVNRFFEGRSALIVPYERVYESNLEASKYLAPLESTFRLKITLSFNESINFLNSNAQRKNRLFSEEYKFSYYSLFDNIFNFSAGIKIYTSTLMSKVENVNFLNKIYFTSAFFNLDFKYKKSLLKIKTDRLLISKEAFTFIDCIYKYDIKKGQAFISVSAQNLLNLNNFEQFTINNYSVITQNYQLLPRIIMVGVNFNF